MEDMLGDGHSDIGGKHRKDHIYLTAILSASVRFFKVSAKKLRA